MSIKVLKDGIKEAIKEKGLDGYGQIELDFADLSKEEEIREASKELGFKIEKGEGQGVYWLLLKEEKYIDGVLGLDGTEFQMNGNSVELKVEKGDYPEIFLTIIVNGQVMFEEPFKLIDEQDMIWMDDVVHTRGYHEEDGEYTEEFEHVENLLLTSCGMESSLY